MQIEQFVMAYSVEQDRLRAPAGGLSLTSSCPPHQRGDTRRADRLSGAEYPKESCTAENAARIPCRQVLGTYQVCFERKS